MNILGGDGCWPVPKNLTEKEQYRITKEGSPYNGQIGYKMGYRAVDNKILLFVQIDEKTGNMPEFDFDTDCVKVGG